jgi:hypothetical protein
MRDSREQTKNHGTQTNHHTNSFFSLLTEIYQPAQIHICPSTALPSIQNQPPPPPPPHPQKEKEK